MDIQVGDRVTYKSSNEPDYQKREKIIENEDDIIKVSHCVKDEQIEILKIERPKYEVIEEKKELLTEEEKEFLKSYIKFIRLENEIEYIEKTKNGIIVLWFSNSGNYKFEIDRYENFIGIQTDKRYTLKELGLK